MANEFFKQNDTNGDSSQITNGLRLKNHNNRRPFQFHTIMIQAVVKHTARTEIIACWRYPDYFSACKGTSVNWFRQMRKCLHWIKNDKTSRFQDTSNKVRPILHYLNLTLGYYIDTNRRQMLITIL